MENPSGILLIDKPSGISSSNVVQTIKKIINIKTGHLGTLDPLATGLLVILIGRATKLQDYFLTGQKVYSGVIRLGVSSTTDDLEGDILEHSSNISLNRKLLDQIENKFTGSIQQIPPQFSAIKVNGKRAYKEALAGKDVNISAREVNISSIKLDIIENNKISYLIKCSKGTYIRSIARDIGEYLNSGGLVESIRRLHSEPFSLNNAFLLDKIKNKDDVFQNLISIDKLFETSNNLKLLDQEIKDFKDGKKENVYLKIKDLASSSVVLKNQKNEPIAVVFREETYKKTLFL